MTTKVRNITEEITKRKPVVVKTVEKTYTQAEVMALIAHLGLGTTTAVKAAPKPRAKASHGEDVTRSQTATYQALWRKRLDLRKELGLGGWKEDEASTDAKMVAVVTKMTALRTAGVNQFLLKPAK